MLPFALTRKIWGAFALAAAALVLLVTASGLTVRALVDASRWVAHTHEVMAQVAELRSDVTGAETAQRGALLSGDPSYRSDYAVAKARAGADLATLAGLTADNPSQRGNVSRLGPILERRFARAEEALASPDAAQARALVGRGAGRSAMTEAVALLDRMRDEEQGLLSDRTARAERRARLALALLVLVGLAAVSMLAAAVRDILRDLQRRVALEEEIARFFDLSVDLLCIAGFDGRFLRLNRSWQKLLGYRVEDLIGRQFIDFVHPEDRAKTEAESAALAAGTPTVGFENRYRARDGSYRILR